MSRPRFAVLAAALSLLCSLVVTVSGGGAATPATGSFPVTVTTADGKVTVKAKPTRIVSLSPTATETLFAIGAGSQVVAVDDQSDYPKAAPKTTLSGFTPNVEAIASYRPDLVVASYDPKGMADALRKLGIPVVIQGTASSIKTAYQQMRQLGALTGHADASGALVTRIKQRIAGIARRVKGKASGLSVYAEISPDFYAASSFSFLGQAFSVLGIRNIADAADSAKSGFPKLSAEYIVSSSPDIIVLADSVCCAQSVAAVAQRPGWDRVSAVRTRSMILLNDSVASRWGPRMGDLFRALEVAVNRLKAQ